MNSVIPIQNAAKTNHQLGLMALIRRSRPINILTGPIIYSMVVPLLFLDLSISLYQSICFPVYKVAKVSRRDFIIFDRQELKYLDWISKFHCTYCAYGVGVVAFAGAVIGKTEAYFCPIKHKAHHRPSTPALPQYLEYAEPPGFDYGAQLSEIRDAMGESTASATKSRGAQNE